MATSGGETGLPAWSSTALVRSVGCTFRSYEPSDEASTLRLLRRALGETPATRRTSDFWRWKHFENPFGESFLRVACDADGEVVGLRAFMRWQLDVDGRRVPAVQAVDTATDPAYRRRGVFSELTRQSVEEVRRAGISIIFNTPNATSRPGYQKLGWHDVGTVTPLVLVANRARFAVRILASGLGIRSHDDGPRTRSDGTGSASRVLTEDPGSLVELVRGANAESEGKLVTRRSLDYLRWRYALHPNLAYESSIVTQRGHPAGATIVRINNRFGLRELLLSEIFVAQKEPTLLSNLIDRLRERYRPDYLVAYAPRGSSLRTALRRCGFIAPPDRIVNGSLESRHLRWPEHQKPRRLMINVLSWDPSADPFRLENWGLSAGDIEVF
jgi:predicted N-acetyltransferase YhbS